MLPNGDRPHPEPQEVLGGTALLILIGLIASHRDARIHFILFHREFILRENSSTHRKYLPQAASAACENASSDTGY
jgi:hypothetical protein